jgi:hypothetical protein
MTIDVIPAFDYGALSVENRISIQQKTSEIRSLIRRSAQDAIEIGSKLIEVKDRLAHGQFGTWLNTEFGWSDRLARQYMLVAAKMADYANLDQIAPSALYLLAAGTTPDDVRREFVEQAAAGQPVTYSAVKTAISSAKPASNRLVGETHTITEPESPYYGDEVVIDRHDGEFVYATTPQGESKPFLPGWIGEQPPEKIKVEPKPDQKTQLLDSLEFKVSVKEQRIEILEKYLTRVLDEVSLPDDLYYEIERLLA